MLSLQSEPYAFHLDDRLGCELAGREHKVLWRMSRMSYVDVSFRVAYICTIHTRKMISFFAFTN